MELKLASLKVEQPSEDGSNCTFMELKFKEGNLRLREMTF